MSERISRGELLEKTAFAVVSAKASPFPADSFVAIDSFDRPDSTYHGDDWETLTPGFWRIQNQALARDLANLGEAPYGMLWNRHWNLRSNYTIEADFSLKKRVSNSGQGLMGICFGGKSLYESWHGGGNPGDACWYAAWRDNGRFGIYDHSSDRPVAVTEEAQFDSWSIDQTITLRLRVTHSEDGSLPTIDAELVNVAGAKVSVKTDRRSRTEGYFGIVSRGLLGFGVSQVRLLPGTNRAEAERLPDLIVAYPLATSLKKAREGWFARFVCLFRQEGKEALIRVSTRSTPAGGWNSEAVAGRAPIVQNSFRENTAVIEAKLPGNPSEAEFYYTVWKDGKDVTVDPRGAPYAGRLPRLTAPYRFAGLSCHAISAKQFRDPEKCFPWKVDPAGWRSVSRVEAYENAELFQSNWVFEQALPTAFQHFEEYGFQILLWEDDIWYLEIPIFPPTVRDVYRTIGLTLGGRVQWRQMMRHWNVLNPGDHDFGMDDFKGTEQYAVRTVTSLPQNQNYLRQNFAAVWHLLTGEEENHSTSQPVRYTAWRLPDGDCTLVVTDARLWRTTQAGYLWEKNGWEGRLAWKRNDPTRALLGEAQYAWLQSVIRTAPSPVIVVTGLNALHTIWNRELLEDDRVMADYAGFNKVSCDRLIDLLTSREGILSLSMGTCTSVVSCEIARWDLWNAALDLRHDGEEERSIRTSAPRCATGTDGRLRCLLDTIRITSRRNSRPSRITDTGIFWSWSSILAAATLRLRPHCARLRIR